MSGRIFMSNTHQLFAELEATLTNAAGLQRFTILRKITDLFLSSRVPIRTITSRCSTS